MTRLRFDTQDKQTLAALDADFTIDDSSEVATITGAMKVEVMRAADDRLRLRISFPGDEKLDVQLSRARLLQELDVTES